MKNETPNKYHGNYGIRAFHSLWVASNSLPTTFDRPRHITSSDVRRGHRFLILESFQIVLYPGE